jgi:rRNA maturation RNase YbeY
MANVTTLIFVESRYKVTRKRIRQTVARSLAAQNILTNVEVSVAIVGDRKMKLLNEKYRKKEGTTNILTFPLAEGEQTKLPASETTHLGDIVISYPVVLKEAARDDMLVDEKVEELVAHGLNHLLGIHHE